MKVAKAVFFGIVIAGLIAVFILWSEKKLRSSIQTQVLPTTKSVPSNKVYIFKIADNDGVSVYLMDYGGNTYLITKSSHGVAIIKHR